MKVRLKLNYNEYKALIFILMKIAFMESREMSVYIQAVEAENLCRKLNLKLQERPQKHYVVNLNSMQVFTLFYRGILVQLGEFERVVLQDIRSCIDEQYVSESHYRQTQIEAILQETQDFYANNPANKQLNK